MKHILQIRPEEPKSKHFRQGHVIVAQAKAKHLQYAPLINIAKKQNIDGIRNNTPQFVPVVATTHGELVVELISLVEWLTDKYRRKMTYKGSREDGVSFVTLSA